jgi:pilus assembly protein Flp/PilA
VAAFQMLFTRMAEHLGTLRDREEGQGLVEYALIIALVSVALTLSLTGLATGIEGVFTEIVGKL